MKVPYTLPNTKPYTPATVKKLFKQSGVTVAKWAEANGYNRYKVYFILNGQSKGMWGESHRIAVQLGLKIEPEVEIA